MAGLAGLIGLGGSSVQQTANVELGVANNILQAVSNVCSISCNETENGNTVVIANSTTKDITFSQTCSIVGSQCVIATYLETDIDNILSTMANQSSLTTTGIGDLLSGFASSSENINIHDFVTNNISQLVSNNCAITTSQAQNNNYVYVNNSTTGDISFAQSSTIQNTDCIMQTIATAIDITNETANTGQTATIQSVEAVLALVIVAIVVMIIIMILFFVAKPALSKAGKKLSGDLNKGGTA